MKIPFKYLQLALILLIFSCGENSGTLVKKPSDLLSRYELAEILADMHIADAGLQLRHLSVDSINRMNAGYADFILNKHHVKRQQFETSFDYYLSVPVEMDSVYMLVVDVLNLRETKSRGVSVPPGSPSK